jgi:NAD(P)-dependent dehydrogenase (short-subunit alcohol dehydrogenase family)
MSRRANVNTMSKLSEPFDFSGKVAVITGGSGVLCGALALALGEQGASVAVLAHKNLEKAKRTVAKISGNGGKALALQANVMEKESLNSAAQQIGEQLGPIDILVNGAGGARKEATTGADLSFFDLPEEAVRWVFDLNFLGTFLACQVFGQELVERERGTILNISSFGADRPLTRSVAYSAAKASIVNFTRWLAVHFSQEYSPKIRVNALAPGFFLTEQNRFLLFEELSGELTERGQRIIAHTPLGRFGDPEDLVGPALVLLSDLGSFVHGTTLVVDGGISAYGGV